MILRFVPQGLLRTVRGQKGAPGLPHRLERNRLYIVPTRYGLLFLLILLAMLLGSINYGNNLGFLFTFLLGGMVFVSMWHTYRNLVGIEVVSVKAPPVFAGEEASFRFVVRVGPPARPAVAFSFPKERVALADLDPDGDRRVDVPVKALRRGRLRPGPLVVHTRYPLGLFRSWYKVSVNAQCIVYPQPLPGALETAYGPGDRQSGGGAEGPGVDDFQGLRPYVPGDPLQRVSWKAFSRGQGLFTKLFVEERGKTLLLEWNVVRESDEERKICRLTAMVLKAHDLQAVYGLHLPGQSIEPNRGEAHKHACLKALALYRGAGGAP